jgi:two-component system OmpR family response regulator
VTKRILLVDDEEPILHAIGRYLTRGGFAVDCARELEEAEALLSCISYDLVIADLALTEPQSLEGLEIIRHARRTSPRTRLILLTGHGSPTVEKEALRRGCDTMVMKPKALPELVKIAVALMGSAA